MSSFRFLALPSELQGEILSLAYDSGCSPTSLLCISPLLKPEILALLYTHIFLPSIPHVLFFLSKGSGAIQHAHCHATSFTFSTPGVPGGSTRGGRESAPSRSPERQHMSTTRHLNDRLLLAARAMQLCPRLRHCSLQMFGVRHSSLLTSDDYIAEEMSAFRLAIAQLKHLRSFAWTTPKENANFVGFSVAVVDLAFEPLIEGLEIAALDINIEGRRVAREKGDIQRYRHPLQRITLHHCIFPSNQGKLFFHLFTKKHPDDDGVLLFSHLNLIYISKAINVEPRNVAYLALSWQLCLLNKRKLSHLPHEEDWNPVVILEDVFVNSIWGPRLTEDLILENIRDLVEVSLLAGRERSSSSNAYIRALEESVEMGTKLDEAVCKQIRSMLPWQREGLINQACKRVQIRCVEGSIASYQ